ncbi:MAG: 3'-5' exonuclease [Acidimicrobiia bacterium]|nr:3'-5' exonuclease [Acidimicrobiia bacterium]
MSGLRHWGRRRTVADFIASSPGPLADYYRRPVAFDPTLPWSEADYLVLDVEATAVDPEQGHLLSMGWVCVEQGAIQAGTARHHLVRPPEEVGVGQSAVIHHITDTEAREGSSPEEVVEALVDDLQGRVLVCHFAQIELGFAGRICQDRWGIGFWPWQLVDTMQWHVDRSRRLLEHGDGQKVRLNRLMERYGLPPTRPHHALSDAYGTALLLMAIGRNSPDGSDRGRLLGELLDSRSWSM